MLPSQQKSASKFELSEFKTKKTHLNIDESTAGIPKIKGEVFNMWNGVKKKDGAWLSLYV